jgi:predicted nucleotidyltransferase
MSGVPATSAGSKGQSVGGATRPSLPTSDTVVPNDVLRFGEEMAGHLARVLDGGLVGAYFVGSVALGGFVAGESDVDVIAVCDHRVTSESTSRVAEAVLTAADGCPARGLEFTLYRREVAVSPPVGADFEANINEVNELLDHVARALSAALLGQA